MNDRSIKYLKRKDLDIQKWDECIERNANGLVYAKSVYLDIMTDAWDAIVINDYEAVLPLPIRKKFGIGYYYKPAFIQQLGIIGYLSPDWFPAVVNNLTDKIKYGDLLLNFDNAELSEFVGARPMINMIIDLSEGYSIISAKYRIDVKNAIKRSLQERLIYTRDVNVEEIINLYRKEYDNRIHSVSAKDYECFIKLCRQFYSENMVVIRKVTDYEGNLFSIVLLINDGKRIYNLINVTTAAGRRRASNYYLYDRLIKEFEGKSLILDMEGSEHEGIRLFYRKFGCSGQPYYLYHFNKLHPLIRLFKS